MHQMTSFSHMNIFEAVIIILNLRDLVVHVVLCRLQLRYVLTLNFVANLQSVTLSTHWLESHVRYDCLEDSSHSNAYLTGSPLARSWNLFHIKPLAWMSYEGRAKKLNTSDGALELMFLSNALAIAKRSPAKFALGARQAHGITPTEFDYQNRDLKLSSLCENTFYALTHLELHLASDFFHEGRSEVPNAITGLGSVLISLARLEYLRLNLPMNIAENCGLYTYRQIFGRTVGKWPRLHTFIIRSLVIGTEDLTLLLTESMPALQNLKMFSTMKLLDGQWNWIIAYMRQLNLSSLKIDSDYAFKSPDGRFYLEERYHYWDERYCLFTKNIPEYVLDGGRHPGLLPHQKDNESDRYLEELQNFCTSSPKNDWWRTEPCSRKDAENLEMVDMPVHVPRSM